MQTNSQIRQSSLAAMKGNWGSAILLYVVSCVLYVPYGILNRGGAIAGLAVLLLIFVYLPINFGLLRTFLAFARDKRPLTIEGLFCAFNNTYYWKAIGTGLLSGIYTFLWTLLLIVPGIIKGLSYAMALYIVSDNPEIGCDEAIERSMAMMRGHKMRLFLMQLGMIGWSLLSLLTLGIAMLWIVCVAFARILRLACDAGDLPAKERSYSNERERKMWLTFRFARIFGKNEKNRISKLHCFEVLFFQCRSRGRLAVL